MTDKTNKGDKHGKAVDSDASLQEELSRETAEGADTIGDVGSNRTLSGSSSWETLPDKPAAGGSKKSGPMPEEPGPGKK